MRSRLALSANPEHRGVASRVVGAMFFFILGAIVASELYPRVDAAARVSELRSGPTPPSAARILDGLDAVSQRDTIEYTGGPIPEPTFTAQTVAALAARDTQALPDDDHSSSVANGEKPNHTASKPMQKQDYSHRRNATQNRRYREQTSYEAARRYWNPSDWGNREWPLAMSR